METKIHKLQLQYLEFKVNAMALVPTGEHSKTFCLFTHGYTASKTDVLPWAIRCADAGIPSLIFDLPGHYLGSFNEVESFETFKNHAHGLFFEAYSELKKITNKEASRVILAGHSLGALMSGWAMDDKRFGKIDKVCVGVGLGLNQGKHIHVFESSFYQKTLNIRRQLVSPSLDSDIVFSWIKDEKEKISISDHRIHLITGIDDIVVGKGGMQRLAELLERNGCEVTTHEPTNLPHHKPELAATHLFSFLKNEKLF